jgi:hypothetical protein
MVLVALVFLFLFHVHLRGKYVVRHYICETTRMLILYMGQYTVYLPFEMFQAERNRIKDNSRRTLKTRFCAVFIGLFFLIKNIYVYLRKINRQ